MCINIIKLLIINNKFTVNKLLLINKKQLLKEIKIAQSDFTTCDQIAQDKSR